MGEVMDNQPEHEYCEQCGDCIVCDTDHYCWCGRCEWECDMDHEQEREDELELGDDTRDT